MDFSSEGLSQSFKNVSLSHSSRYGVVRGDYHPPVCRNHNRCCNKNQALYVLDQIQTRLVSSHYEADFLPQSTNTGNTLSI